MTHLISTNKFINKKITRLNQTQSLYTASFPEVIKNILFNP